MNAPSTSSRPAGTARSRLAVVAALCVLLVMASGLTILTLGRLDHVYSWDQIGYHEKAVRLSHDLRSSPVSALRGIARSVRNQHYNDLAAVPLAGWVALFGEHRQSFVLGVLILYAMPTSALFSVVMGTAYRRFCGRSPTFWLQVGWLLTPWLIGAFWTPTVLGRVGVGGLGLVFAAVALHLQRPLETQKWWHPVAVGCLLAAAVLFQRWYLFAVVGILAAVTAQALLAVRRPGPSSGRLRAARNFLLVTSMPVAVLGVLTMPLIRRIVDTEYVGIFGYYHHPGSMMYLWGNPWSLVERLGLPSLLVVVAAIAAGVYRREMRGFLAAAALAGAVSLALFARVQAPGVHHIMIWVGVECVFLGIGLVHLSALPSTAARIALWTSVTLLSTSVASVLLLSRDRGPGSDARLWSALAPSLTVGDFVPKNMELVRATVKFLETHIAPGSSIALLSSGLRLNGDTLRKINFTLPDCDLNVRYRFVMSRPLSRHGRFPDFLLRADYVVVVDMGVSRALPGESEARIPPERLFQGTSPFAECFDRVAGPVSLPGGGTIAVLKLREGLKRQARKLLVAELEALFSERRGSDQPP